MTRKDKPTIEVKGGIHSGRDTILGDQYNYGGQTQQIANIQTPPQFIAALADLQAQIATLKQQTELTSVQRRVLEDAEKQVTDAAAEVQKPQADGGKIQKALTEAKDTMDMLAGSVKSAVGLGTMLAGLIEIGIKLFGG